MENIFDKTKFESFVKQKNKLEKKIKKEANAAFKEATQKFFEKYGHIIPMFMWQQYIPYFNDGDACEFGICDIIFPDVTKIKEENENIDDLEYWDLQEYDYAGKDKDLNSAIKMINDFIYSNDNLMRDLFGDHSTVKCTKKGIEVESYEDHD